MMTEAEKADDSRRGYNLAMEAIRETRVRLGDYAPLPSRPHEARWRQDGMVPRRAELDTLK